MRAKNAADEFRRHLKAQGLHLTTITPQQGVDAMLAFYGGVRADDCMEADGDMLLFQWGTYDWGQEKHFSFDITRQLIVGAAEDDDIWQLSLTFKYAPSDELAAIGSGNRWCSGLAQIDDFRAFIHGGTPYRLVASRKDAECTLVYECAG